MDHHSKDRGTYEFFTGNVNDVEDELAADALDLTSNPHKPITLRANGYLVPALLQYQDTPMSDSLHNERSSGTEESGIVRSHNILKYGLKFHRGEIDLDFHPDWISSFEGPKFIPNRTRLFLFHITGNVYLVLKEQWFFDTPCVRRVHYKQHMTEALRSKINAQTERVLERASRHSAAEENAIDHQKTEHHKPRIEQEAQMASRSLERDLHHTNASERSDTVHASGSRSRVFRDCHHECDRSCDHEYVEDPFHYSPLPNGAMPATTPTWKRGLVSLFPYKTETLFFFVLAYSANLGDEHTLCTTSFTGSKASTSNNYHLRERQKTPTRIEVVSSRIGLQ
ncbi:hypothetical protein IQ06DRAFT_305261 [Phaeosphaeriaceae sp. SRC1lsM3a]|nr:hypothetical protein IQ06DRAFT_305261 [Stagonospora sp. SRC1lsM3a]